MTTLRAITHSHERGGGTVETNLDFMVTERLRCPFHGDLSVLERSGNARLARLLPMSTHVQLGPGSNSVHRSARAGHGERELVLFGAVQSDDDADVTVSNLNEDAKVRTCNLECT